MTPEERLFKIIQNQESNQDETNLNSLSTDADLKANLATSKTESKAVSEKSAPDLDGDAGASPEVQNRALSLKHFLFANSGAALLSGLQQLFSLKVLNRVLALFTVALILLFVTDLFFIKSDPIELFFKKTNLIASPEQALADVPLAAGVIPDTQSISQRNVFRPWVQPQVAAPQVSVASDPSSGYSSKVLTNVKLVGIYMDDTPEALMEAVEEKRTYVVQAGSEIKGMKVKEIKAEGVVLSDGKEEYFLQ